MNKKVIEIISTLPEKSSPNHRHRVAAYCRVSTDQEEQQTSFEMQIKYYTEKIKSNPKWILVDIFADEGITGTSDKKRPEFMRMVGMCQKGKIDLILTKSISRFSRNTVDCLSWVRNLKSLGVAVCFEKEGIHTGDAIGETFLTWFSAFAQAESESISQNVTWGKRKGFKEGRFNFPYHNLIGYEKGEDDTPIIVEDEAIIVRRIYNTYLDGLSLQQIKDWLDVENILSPSGNANWSKTTIQSILQNEKYCGDALCQKAYTVDFLTKERRKNKGELPQYLIEDNHPAIISKNTFQQVQQEMERRASIYKPKGGKSRYSGKFSLSNLVICGECGAAYRRVTWARNGKKKIVWRCINRLETGTRICKHSPSIQEDMLKESIMNEIQKKLSHRNIAGIVKEELMNALYEDHVSSVSIQKQIKNYEKEILALRHLSKDTTDFSFYSEKIQELDNRIKNLQEQLNFEQDIKNQEEKIEILLKELTLSEQERIDTCFDQLVRRVLQSVVINNGTICVNFMN